jgi:hypothetical protein
LRTNGKKPDLNIPAKYFPDYEFMEAPSARRRDEQEAEGRRDIACTVSFLTFLKWWVISAALY